MILTKDIETAVRELNQIIGRTMTDEEVQTEVTARRARINSEADKREADRQPKSDRSFLGNYIRSRKGR